MKLDAHTATAFDGRVAYSSSSPANSRGFFAGRNPLLRRVSVAQNRRSSSAFRSVSYHGGGPEDDVTSAERSALSRRRAILAPSLALGAWFVRSAIASGEDSPPLPAPAPAVTEAAEKEEVISSRIYDATVIGEPMAVGKDRAKVWEKLMSARIVYLGEAEQVPIRDDRDLELEIVRSLRKRCAEIDRPISVALEAFPCDFQDRLDQFMDQRIDGETLKSFMSFWPPERWQEYEPLLSFCRDNGVRLVACGTPLMVLRTVQAEGIAALSKADRKLYTPPAGSGFISGFTSVSRQSPVDLSYPSQPVPFTPSSYLSAQARVVEDHTMSRTIMEAMVDRGMMVVVTGSSHLTYGTRGTGVPARVSKKIQKKKNQVVILLHPERQQIRREGEVPVADFLWYSAARPCNRNCFDRAEIARVMNAAGRNRDALPQDLQQGLDRGLVSPEVLQNFFDLEKNPLISGLTNRYQGFRERLLADPKFLNRLAIEETISITTNLIAQYQRRRENFFEELDYVVTDTVRGVIVDFFTVWLPAPTISFISSANDGNALDGFSAITDLLGSIPDNAFQKNPVGRDWNLNHRLASVIFGGLKLAAVGFISSIGAVASSNSIVGVRRFLNPALISEQQTRTSPVLKSAVVYATFLGISANLRYQFIAGIVEHRLADEFASQTLFVNMLSFVVRTINSYWATLQWVDLARYTGLQSRKEESSPFQDSDSPNPTLECNNVTEDANLEEIQSQQGDNPV